MLAKETNMNRELLKRSVLRVGSGRGFSVHGNMVITAAHCLPHPPPCSSYDPDARIYEHIVWRLVGEITASAVCSFVDSIMDIAEVDQAYANEGPKGFKALALSSKPFAIGAVPKDGKV